MTEVRLLHAVRYSVPKRALSYMHFHLIIWLLCAAMLVEIGLVQAVTNMKILKNVVLKNKEGSDRADDSVPGQAKCGISHHESLARILGGTLANEGDWPWMVYLYEKERGKDEGFICGGVLISNRWILTAAHCIRQPKYPELYKVALGKHWSRRSSQNEKSFKISKIIRHADFSEDTFDHDIALLELSRPALFTKYISPICLTRDIKFHPGQRCTALGWGTAGPNQLKSDVLKQLSLKIFPKYLCTLRSKAKAYNGLLVKTDDSKICAGGQARKDTCEGDSGGPLLCEDEATGKYFLHGITSYGPNPCGQAHLPGVYTQVADYVDWISENTSGN